MTIFTPLRAAAAGLAFIATSLLSAPASADIIHADDVIINSGLTNTSNLCVGVGCLTDGTERFEDDTIRLKESNLRINFRDTSSTALFPTNDWRIVINDTFDGGAEYFAIEDTTAGNQVFRIDDGAPLNALYVDSLGKVGLGTATPADNLHIRSGGTTSIRLEQDASSGTPPSPG